MVTETLLSLLVAGAVGIAFMKSRRAVLYRDLERRVAALTGSSFQIGGPFLQRSLPPFDDRIAHLPEVLPTSAIDVLKQQALALVGPERSFIPTHKKGGTIAYESLFDVAPALVALYHSEGMRKLVSRIVGESVEPTPIHDQSSLSVLFYEKPGDHIGWHYDHNFYRGRHFTVLLPIINQGSGNGGLSHATLKARVRDQEIDIATPPNTLVVFEGARVNHKVTPIIAGERRLVISMTYCTDPRANAVQGVVRRIKDVSFFGLRALWT